MYSMENEPMVEIRKKEPTRVTAKISYPCSVDILFPSETRITISHYRRKPDGRPLVDFTLAADPFMGSREK